MSIRDVLADDPAARPNSPFESRAAGRFRVWFMLAISKPPRAMQDMHMVFSANVDKVTSLLPENGRRH